jgi:dnd system-associated protein 4
VSGDSADPRVYIPADKEEVLTFLTEEGPFETRAAVLAFAASLGYKEGRREAVDKGPKDIRWGVFQEEGKSFVADLIAAAESEDLSIMRDERGADRRRVFAEYANGGLALLRNRVMNKPRDAVDVLLEIILAAESPRATATGTEGLERLAAKVERERRLGEG